MQTSIYLNSLTPNCHILSFKIHYFEYVCKIHRATFQFNCNLNDKTSGIRTSITIFKLKIDNIIAF